MPFAVKLKQNEVMALSSAQSVHLVLTSITLDPSSKKANLFVRSKQSEELVLITKLERQKLQVFSCSITLTLMESETEQLTCTEGEIHLVGHFNPMIHGIGLYIPSIKIVRKALKQKQEKKKVGNKEKMMKPAVKIQKSKQIPLQKPKKKLNLLEMINNVADDEDDQDQSDDCYEAEEDEDDQSESSSEQSSEEKVPATKKKISWAAMLQDASDQEDSEEYSQSNSESSSEDQSQEQEEKPMKKRKKKIKVDSLQEKGSSQSKNQEKEKLEAESEVKDYSSSKHTEKEEKIQKKSKIVVKSDSESSSFEFPAPKGLPSFIENK